MRFFFESTRALLKRLEVENYIYAHVILWYRLFVFKAGMRDDGAFDCIILLFTINFSKTMISNRHFKVNADTQQPYIGAT